MWEKVYYLERITMSDDTHKNVDPNKKYKTFKKVNGRLIENIIIKEEVHKRYGYKSKRHD